MEFIIKGTRFGSRIFKGYDLSFRVKGSGFKGFGFRVQGLRFKGRI